MKLVVEIDLHNHTIEDYEAHRADWHPTGDASLVSIDAAYLPVDPTDDSFVLLKLIEVREG